MKLKCFGKSIFLWVLSVVFIIPLSFAQEETKGPGVKIEGVMMLGRCCIRNRTPEDKLSKQIVIFAVDGSPEVKAAFNDVMKDLIAGKSIDYDGAMNIENEFNKRLKYYIVPNKFTEGKEKDYQYLSPIKTVTGIVSEKDGKKWIEPSSITQLNKITYPEGILKPDKPLKKCGKNPLVIKITDDFSIKCILIPAGKFMFRNPFYVYPRWVDEWPHAMTLTKPFYLAETPITQEMYEAVMNANPSTIKDPKRPVRNVNVIDIKKFCKILSEKNKREVRLPGEAEWEYAARVGTSNPPLWDKFKNQCSDNPAGKKQLLPVMSKEPNAWGLYDMVSDVFEITRDKCVFDNPDTKDCIDPYLSCEKEEEAGKKISHMGTGSNTGKCVNYHEDVGNGAPATGDTNYCSTKFRIVVEATPEEIDEIEKENK